MIESGKRNSNIEVLRIISMLMIVAGHFAGQGGIKEQAAGGISKIILFVLGSGQRVAINIFLLISVWFLVEQQFKATRLIRVWGEVFFYTVSLTICLMMFGHPVSLKELVKSFLPFLGRPLWFASAYIALIMLTPFLNNIYRKFTKRQLKAMVVVLGLITCVLPTVASEMDTYLCAIAWFVFVYFLVAYFKKYFKGIQVNGMVCIFAGIILYLAMSCFAGVCVESSALVAAQHLAERFLHDFKSIPNFLCAFLIFYGVILMKERKSKMINELAAGSFAVYIVHQTPAFYPVLWKTLTDTGLYRGKQLIPIFIVTVFMLYILISCLDIVRRRFIEPKILKNRMLDRLCSRIENFYAMKEESYD